MARYIARFQQSPEWWTEVTLEAESAGEAEELIRERYAICEKLMIEGPPRRLTSDEAWYECYAKPGYDADHDHSMDY